MKCDEKGPSSKENKITFDPVTFEQMQIRYELNHISWNPFLYFFFLFHSYYLYFICTPFTLMSCDLVKRIKENENKKKENKKKENKGQKEERQI